MDDLIIQRTPSRPDREARTLPDRIADELIARVFTGELAPGDRLPPERVLAAELGVDRTSLRMALRQLSRMKLVRAVQGSGVTVLDYRQHAGLDFLAAVLEVPGLELGGAFLLEALAHWERAIPQITARALARAAAADAARLDALFAAQLRALDAGDDLTEAAEVQLDLQDALIGLLDDTTLRLVANATRGLRRRLTRLQLSLVDARAQVRNQRDSLRAALASKRSRDTTLRAHGAELAKQHASLRAHLAALPPGPWRTARWDPRLRAVGDRED